MIHVPCPGCNKKLGIAEKFAGRLILCPACRTKVRVPTPEQPAPVEELEELEEIDDVLPAGRPRDGITAEADPPRRRRPPEEDDYDEEDRPRRRRRRIPKPRRRKLKYEREGGIFSEGIFGMEVFTVVMIGGALLSLLLLALSFIPVIGALFALAAMLLGSIMAITAQIWVLILAFSEDATTGFFCLIIPFYFFYFVLTEFDTCKRPVLVYGVGLLLVLGGGCASGAWSEARSFGPRRFGALPAPPPAHVAGAPRRALPV